MLFGGRGQPARLQFAEPSDAVASDHIVDRISDGGWDESKNTDERERKTEKGEHAKHGSGSQKHAVVFDQNDRTDASVGQSCLTREGRSGRRLAGGKTKDIFAVETQKEIDPAVTKGAFTVKNNDCVPGGIHNFIVSEGVKC